LLTASSPAFLFPVIDAMSDSAGSRYDRLLAVDPDGTAGIEQQRAEQWDVAE
jgi:hypothetical protein